VGGTVDGPASALEIEVSSDDPSGAANVMVDGELDVSNVDRLYECVRKLIREGQSNIVLNLRRLRYMDSTGMAILVAARKRAADVGGQFRVEVQPNSIVARLLEISGLLRILTEDPQAATATATAKKKPLTE
jgi:anti-sigma B factor antagonist